MSSGGSLLDPPSTPTPSTSDLSIHQLQLQPPQQPQPLPTNQGVREAFKIPNILYSVIFSILWLFGLARNLASYVVSLGIIPLKTATRLFGIKPSNQQQPHPNPNANARVRQQNTRHQVDKSTLGKRQTWSAHKSSKPSDSSSVPRTVSVPSTPQTRRVSLQSVEPATDSEQIAHRPRNRRAPGSSTSSTRRIVFQDVIANEESEVTETGVRRSRVDHSTRRIVFVDPKQSRRQTAPPVPYQSPSPAPAPAQEITESPVQETVALPAVDSNPTPRPKSTPQQPSSRPATNEFGEFVPARVPVDQDTASGTESTLERKSRGKDRLRSLFGKKRSSSVASNGDATKACSLPKGSVKNGSNRLRRKSPYPAMATAPPVTVSDAESNISPWLRSRPRKLSRKARSNSLSEDARIPAPLPSICLSPSADMLPQNTSPLPLPPTPLPLFRSSTMASTATSTSSGTSSSALCSPGTPNAHKRSSTGATFNPIRELEARLYRHGVGTGPAHDALTYVTTPVPKTGIKRTNPYVLLGMERPTLTPSPRSSRVGPPVAAAAPAPPRRESAPAEECMKRPVTPRAHTQPL